jgi:hypothetical protein
LEQSGGLHDHPQTLTVLRMMEEDFSYSHSEIRLAQETQIHRDQASTQINPKQE